jgi:hypothetical protein
VPILERKPGALRHGEPFKTFELPKSMERVCKKLNAYPDGDKQWIKLLLQVREYGLDKVESCCADVLSKGICHADSIVKCIKSDPKSTVFQERKLVCQPDTDCDCYNQQLLTQEVKNV